MSKNLSLKFEHLLIKIKGKTSYDFIILGVLYKPPNYSFNEWLENFHTLIQELLQDTCPNFLLGGDFNIDLNSDHCNKKLS